ncbi:hypothetical protein GGG16DRAFT_125796 [Schizophyllum commune]
MAATDADLENFRRYLNQFERGCQQDSDVEDAIASEESPLNLGMETPRTVASTPRFASRPVSRGAPSPAPDVYGNVWTQQRDDKALLTSSIRRRRSPTPSKLGRRVASRDTDCGICFEDATMPCRTLCCGSTFCVQHIADWLHGDDADSRCPSCGAVCAVSTSLARDPGLHLPIPNPPPPYLTPLHTSPLPPSPPSDADSSSESDHDQSGPGFSDGDTTDGSPVRRSPPKTLSAAFREPDFAANMVGKLLSIAALIIFYYVILNKSAPAAEVEVL